MQLLDSDVDLSIVDKIDQLPVNEPLDCPVEQQELEQSLKNTKLGKSPGEDGVRVFPEILVHGARCLWTFLLTLFNIVWASELIPTDWIDAIITILFKRDILTECGRQSLCRRFVLQRLHLPAITVRLS